MGSGCIHRPAAETILYLRCPGESENRPISFAEVFARGDRVEGYGWHPREHKSYAFVGNEPLPVCQERFITIGPAEETQSAKPANKMLLRVEICPELLRTATDSITWATAESDEALLMFEGNVQVQESNYFGRRILKLDEQRLNRVGDPNQFVMIAGRIVARPWPNKKNPEWSRHRPQH